MRTSCCAAPPRGREHGSGGAPGSSGDSGLGEEDSDPARAREGRGRRVLPGQMEVRPARVLRVAVPGVAVVEDYPERTGARAASRRAALAPAEPAGEQLRATPVSVGGHEVGRQPEWMLAAD